MLPRNIELATLASAALVICAGCRSTLPAELRPGPVPTDSNAALVLHIAELPYVTAEPAYRAAYFVREDRIYEGTYPELRTALIERGIVPRRWEHDPHTMLTRAESAYLLARAIELRSGMNWVLFGLERYALRELQYQGVAGPGGELTLISGGEFNGMLSRALEVLRERRGNGGVQVELGGEPSAPPAASDTAPPN